MTTSLPRRAATLLAVGALASTAIAADGRSDDHDDAAAPGVVASWDFEDGLQGWAVEDADGSPDTWEHTDHANGSAGAVGLSGYHNLSSTLLLSPVVDDAPLGGVLEFRASYWLEGGHYDFVDVLVREEGGAWRELALLEGRGRWPLWDLHRYRMPVRGSVQFGFRFTSDELCHGGPVKPSVAAHQVNASLCGQGFWLDDVRLGTSAAFDEGEPAWGNGPRAYPMDEGDTGGGDLLAVIVPESDEHLVTRAAANELDDQATNPEFHEAMDLDGPVHMDQWWRDPLVDWDGRTREAWFLNRYETPLGLRMYAPAADGEYPLVVLVGALGGAGWTAYDSLVQRIVDEGYVVASIVPQGDGVLSTIRSAVLPAPRFCDTSDATRTAWWRQPQEAGLVERQTCAGTLGAFAAFDDREGLGDAYVTAFGAPFVLSTLDAVDWLLGDENPWVDLIDDEAGVGTFGNSAGAWAAMVAAQVDERIEAAAMLDGYGLLGEIAPTTPTLTFGYDQYGMLGEYALNPVEVAEGFREAGVDAGYLHHAATGHIDATWSPYTQGTAIVGGIYAANYACNCRNPLAKPIHQHYLLAWFDRFLKGDPTAADRLTATTFDGSADRTARGTGRWVPGEGNVPYRIEGLAVADTLNDNHPSWMFLDGTATDLNR